MGTGALRGAGRTRCAVTGATPGRGPAFTKPPGAPSPGVRVTGWHANDRTRVLPRLNGQPEPRAVLARAPRDLPCSPREPCRPGEPGPRLVTGPIGGADAAHPRNIRTAAEASALRHGSPQADCAAWATAAGHHPPAAAAQPGRRRLSAQACGPRSAAAGPPSTPPDLPAAPGRCHRRDLAVNVQPTGSLNPAGPNSSAARALGAFVTAAPGGRHTSPKRVIIRRPGPLPGHRAANRHPMRKGSCS